MAFSADGTMFAFASTRNEVVFWQMFTWKESRKIQVNSNNVYGMTFSPDGKILALQLISNSGDNRTVALWDLMADKELSAIRGWGPVAYSPDGKRIAFASEVLDPYRKDTFEVWDVTTGEKTITIPMEHNWGCLSMVFSPDGRKLAADCAGLGILVLDVATGQTLFSSDTMNILQGVKTVSFSPDGKILAFIPSSEASSSIEFVDSDSGKKIQTVSQTSGTNYSIHSLFFSPDGKLLLAGGYESIMFWDVKTGTLLFALDIPGRIVTMVRSPDGKTIALGMLNGQIRIWGVAP
jgi:WD40 repeat protein